ncbi:hypothetical protein DICVIV_11003 [Dictyocaulus viviparus]|uniref:Uncharacterized protein n=1 Tax=Dictyocaulus viviparus TaxID=29172 RepID=A0A0D8XEH0_DICVI|nr:hypothetical protein DICVIV_11003 [Dictyocaulus viviparus]
MPVWCSSLDACLRSIFYARFMIRVLIRGISDNEGARIINTPFERSVDSARITNFCLSGELPRIQEMFFEERRQCSAK